MDTATGTVMAAIQCALVEKCVGVVGAAYSQYSEIVQLVLQNYSVCTGKRGECEERKRKIEVEV